MCAPAAQVATVRLIVRTVRRLLAPATVPKWSSAPPSGRATKRPVRHLTVCILVMYSSAFPKADRGRLAVQAVDSHCQQSPKKPRR